MKFVIALVLGAAIGCFLTIQYQGSVNRTVSQVNDTYNHVAERSEAEAKRLSAKVTEAKKALTK
jgi:hypothetical protein